MSISRFPGDLKKLFGTRGALEVEMAGSCPVAHETDVGNAYNQSPSQFYLTLVEQSV